MEKGALEGKGHGVAWIDNEIREEGRGRREGG